ncbi:hypothetical protein [Mycobacteroides saopaulense]|uniref:Uncharacterized protein n=1 Tax=Mycobacteroides saopaulense TaxID=1578165 RepID=A0ABX3BYF5_9MYCO|nr:hypothetical protein [Mycobacteroides saopaulense]OHU08780.1 hypothetical protein BKG73_17340 [Mycobacteroides saopaulense]
MSAEPLQWEDFPDQARYITHKRGAHSGDGYYYVVAYFSHSGLWMSKTYGVFAASGGFKEQPFEDQLYEGRSEAEAIAAAENHHIERVRKDAWRRYMAENDPPQDGKSL